MGQQLSARPARDAYEVLQVRPDAGQVVIRAAFRALAALYHPDADESAGSTRRMAELNDAYAQLRTADRRAVYDRVGPAGQAIHPPERTQLHQRPTGARRESAQTGVLDFGRYVGCGRNLGKRGRLGLQTKRKPLSAAPEGLFRAQNVW